MTDDTILSEKEVGKIQKKITSVISKVLGRAQSGTLIGDIFDESDAVNNGDLTRMGAKALVDMVIRQVPNMSKQKSLQSELYEFIEDI